MDMNAVLEIKNYSKSYGAGKKAADLFEITGSLGDLISAYSHGMKQKVAIISALIHDPKLLVLDEPFVGLDPKASFTLKAVMHELCARGTAIFFSTHVLDVAEKLCNKVAIIRHGSIIASGTMDELTEGHSLEEVFLEAENETYPSYCIFSVVSGMASSFAIANLYFVAFGGVYSATGVILGKALGEGNLEKAREEKTWLLSGSAVFGFAMTGFGLLTTLIVPLVFGRLSDSAIGICRSMVAMMSLFMPVWVYMNTQQAVARAGGDTKMGAYTDAGLTLCVMLPLVFLLARFTNVGPVALYCGVSPCVICVAPRRMP